MLCVDGLTVRLLSWDEAFTRLLLQLVHVISLVVLEDNLLIRRLIIVEVSRALNLAIARLLDRARDVAIALGIRVRLWPLIEINSGANAAFVQVLHIPSIQAIGQHYLLTTLLHAIACSLLRVYALLVVFILAFHDLLFVLDGAAVVHVLVELPGPFLLIAQNLLRCVAIHVALAANKSRLRWRRLHLLLLLLRLLHILQLELFFEELRDLRIFHQLLQLELVLLQVKVELGRGSRGVLRQRASRRRLNAVRKLHLGAWHGRRWISLDLLRLYQV